MGHKFIAGREVLDSRPHPTEPNKVQVKFRTPPRVVNGETRTSVWDEMVDSEYRKKLYFEKPPAGKQTASRTTSQS